MPIERAPIRPIKDPYIPSDSFPYRVLPADDWQSVAVKFGVDTRKLIYFNFQTTSPDEVNWYLRRRTGCVTPSPDGKNWKFAGAKPGIIYIPTKVITFDGDTIEGNPGVEGIGENADALAEEFSHHGPHLVDTILHGVDAGLAAAEMFGLIGSWGAAAGGILGEFGVLLTIGAAHTAAIDTIKRDQALAGLSLGVILGADNRTVAEIKAYGFLNRLVHSAVYPEKEASFQAAYHEGLAIGLAFGRKLNRPQKHALYQAIDPYISTPGDDPKTWTYNGWRNYYIDSAAAFRYRILQLP